LNRLVEEHRDSPDLVKGESTGDQLIRAIRQIAQVKTRLKELKEERFRKELSELFTLREKVRSEMLEGRNLLRQMAARTRTHIAKAERKLDSLIKLNEANDTDNTRFGMNISALR
jgi:hypothetical protein